MRLSGSTYSRRGICAQKNSDSLGSIQTGRANVKTTASLLYKFFECSDWQTCVPIQARCALRPQIDADASGLNRHSIVLKACRVVGPRDAWIGCVYVWPISVHLSKQQYACSPLAFLIDITGALQMSKT